MSTYPLHYFQAKIQEDPKTGCHIWTAAKYSNNYGHIRWQEKDLLAHRVAWEYENGKIPPGLQVCHKCDQPQCCNPDHLFLGTQTDNMRDMINKGRDCFPRGERQGFAKLTEADVLNIRQRIAEGERNKDLAIKYDVDPSTISNIKRREWWAWLEE